jgi:hypothetical protein
VVQLRVPSNPILDHWGPHAIVGADGSFSLTTFVTDDGAPAGAYALTISWPAAPRQRFASEGPDRLHGRFSDPRRPVRQVQIVPGNNDLGRIDLP